MSAQPDKPPTLDVEDIVVWAPATATDSTTRAEESTPWTGAAMEPDYDFSGADANVASHFNGHQIIFDMTFCGDWAGAVYGQGDGCSGSCTDFVANNPTAFAEHFFAIQNLTVYQANFNQVNKPKLFL
jgi:hypothetical protein